MRTILVTGASGFAGRHLLRALQPERSTRVVAWQGPDAGSPPSPPGAEPPQGVTWRQVDVLDPGAVERAVAADPPERVYHLAGAAQVAQSWDHVEATFAVNVLGTHRLLEALRAVAPRARVLLACSGLVYRPALEAVTEESPLGPTSPYGLSKLAEERLGMRVWAEDGQPVVIARAFNHVGPGQSPGFFASSFARQVALIEAGLAPAEIRVGNLEARRDLTDVRDTVGAYRALMEGGSPGEAYNVCSGRAYRIGDVLDALTARARVKVEVRVDPARLRPNDNPLVLGNPGRLARATGWQPTASMDRALDDLLNDWRRRVSDASDD